VAVASWVAGPNAPSSAGSQARWQAVSLTFAEANQPIAAAHLNSSSGILPCVGYIDHRIDPAGLDPDFAQAVAETMQALSTPSRLRILGKLHAGPLSVNELAAAVGMEPSAVSHQLRLLRHLGLVTGRRDGRQIIYDLYDDHVGDLLQQAIGHVEHLHLGHSRGTRKAALTRTSA
jgi:DNA-binding transcriptional ArsR family regulator